MKFRIWMICTILLVCGLQLCGQQADSGVNTLQKPDTFDLTDFLYQVEC
jgi:hypothetical protein